MLRPKGGRAWSPSRPRLSTAELSDDHGRPAAPQAAPTPAPTICPFCASAKLSIPSKKVDASTYWRCEACGQLWNVDRHTAFERGSPGRRRTDA